MKKFIISFLIITNLLCFTSVFASSHEDYIKQKLEENENLLINTIDSNFIMKDYFIYYDKDAAYYEIYITDNRININYNYGVDMRLYGQAYNIEISTLYNNLKITNMGIKDGSITTSISQGRNFLYAGTSEAFP